MPPLNLTISDGTLVPFTRPMTQDFPARANRPFNRTAYADAHVVADSLTDASDLPVNPELASSGMRGFLTTHGIAA